MEKVICKVSNGYNLTIDKEYQVKDLVPRLLTPHFTFPRYATVIDDKGKEATGHAYRFETLDGISLEDYIKENIEDVKDYE